MLLYIRKHIRWHIIMLLVLLERGNRKDYKYVCIVRFRSQIPEIFIKNKSVFGDFRGCRKFVKSIRMLLFFQYFNIIGTVITRTS